MKYRGKFHLIVIYNKQSIPLIKGLINEPSDLGLHCLQKVYKLVSSTIRVNSDRIATIIGRGYLYSQT